MKRLIFIFLLFLSTYFSFGQIDKYPKLDEKNGFRDIKLGSRKSEFKDLILVIDPEKYAKPDNQNAISYAYKRKNENFDFGNIKAQQILYHFSGNFLSSVDIYFDRSDIHTVYESFVELYGECCKEFYETHKSELENKSVYFGWSGKRVILDLISSHRGSTKVKFRLQDKAFMEYEFRERKENKDKFKADF